MKCPHCNHSIPPYKVWLINRWALIKCSNCGKQFGRNRNLQSLAITGLGLLGWIAAFVLLLLFTQLHIIYVTLGSILIGIVFWEPVVMLVDAATIKLVPVDKSSQRTLSNTKDKTNLAKSVALAFNNQKAKSYANESLSAIRSNWQKAEEAVRSAILFLVLLVLAFELLEKSAVKEANIGPFKLGDLSFIQKFIPVLIAYYFYYICNLTLMLANYRIIHETILKKIYPTLEKNSIGKFLGPPYLSIFGDLTFVPSKSPLYSLIDKLQRIFIIIVLFGSILFEIYAFQSLFVLFGLSDILIWISLFISLVLLLRGFLFIYASTEI